MSYFWRKPDAVIRHVDKKYYLVSGIFGASGHPGLFDGDGYAPQVFCTDPSALGRHLATSREIAIAALTCPRVKP